MAIDERSRHQLFTRLEEILGEEHATVLMAHLPPVGWADVATRRDLDQLEARLDSRFEAMDSRFEARLETKLSAQTRTMVQWFMFGTRRLCSLSRPSPSPPPASSDGQNPLLFRSRRSKD
jgi:hypothetical protein